MGRPTKIKVNAPCCPICESIMTAARIETEEGDWIYCWICDCQEADRNKVDEFIYLEQPLKIEKGER